MANVITVVGERKSKDVDEYYVVGDNGWVRLGTTNRQSDLVKSAVSRFEKQLRSGSVLVVANLRTEMAASVSFAAGDFVIKDMNFDDVEW